MLTVLLKMLRFPLSPFVWPSAPLSIVIFCFDSISYRLYLSNTHTENGDGQNIKPNFTSKTLKQSSSLNMENRIMSLWGLFVCLGGLFVVFVFPVSRWRKDGWVLRGWLFFCFAFLPDIPPVPRIEPGTIKQVGSYIFFE